MLAKPFMIKSYLIFKRKLPVRNLVLRKLSNQAIGIEKYKRQLKKKNLGCRARKGEIR